VSDVGKSLKKKDPNVDVEGNPADDFADDYKEPVFVPLFLNMKKTSWEIIINESHLNPTHRLVRNCKFGTIYMMMLKFS
jgi:hypothetical protein